MGGPGTCGVPVPCDFRRRLALPGPWQASVGSELPLLLGPPELTDPGAAPGTPPWGAGLSYSVRDSSRASVLC